MKKESVYEEEKTEKCKIHAQKTGWNNPVLEVYAELRKQTLIDTLGLSTKNGYEDWQPYGFSLYFNGNNSILIENNKTKKVVVFGEDSGDTVSVWVGIPRDLCKYDPRYKELGDKNHQVWDNAKSFNGHEKKSYKKAAEYIAKQLNSKRMPYKPYTDKELTILLLLESLPWDTIHKHNNNVDSAYTEIVEILAKKGFVENVDYIGPYLMDNLLERREYNKNSALRDIPWEVARKLKRKSYKIAKKSVINMLSKIGFSLHKDYSVFDFKYELEKALTRAKWEENNS